MNTQQVNDAAADAAMGQWMQSQPPGWQNFPFNDGLLPGTPYPQGYHGTPTPSPNQFQMEGFHSENTQSLETNMYTQPSPLGNSFAPNYSATPTPAGKRGRDWSPDGVGTDKSAPSKRGRKTDKENVKPKGRGGKKTKSKEAEVDTKKGEHWTQEEITCLVNAIYGPDNEYIYEMSKKHPTKAFKLVIEKNAGLKNRDWESAKSKHGRMRATYGYIIEYESLTGNSNGDPDLGEEEIEPRLERARRAGKAVGTLKASEYRMWVEHGWLELFNSRLSRHPGLVREVEHRSGKLSDLEEGEDPLTDDWSESGDEDGEKTDTGELSSELSSQKSSEGVSQKSVAEKKKKSTTPKMMKKGKSSADTGVPVSRHRGRDVKRTISGDAADILSRNAMYLKAQEQGEKERMELLRRKEVREDEKHRLLIEKEAREGSRAETDAKLQRARDILSAGDEIPSEVKDAARKFLIKYFVSEF